MNTFGFCTTIANDASQAPPGITLVIVNTANQVVFPIPNCKWVMFIFFCEIMWKIILFAVYMNSAYEVIRTYNQPHSPKIYAYAGLLTMITAGGAILQSAEFLLLCGVLPGISITKFNKAIQAVGQTGRCWAVPCNFDFPAA